ncbi:MAG: hypothetical protein EOO05_18635 [Chitinophagaceae bacterium]|nr:MAG: hypothetical protein EOO05_18635 [Chitinophagaceae bacterium]
MKPISRFCLAFLFLSTCIASTHGQSASRPVAANELRPEAKPYKVLTTGNQVTIRCTKDIKTLMAWTVGGSRILEKTVLAQLYSFRVPTQHKMLFLRIELTDGKTYSEKIGVN